MVGTEGLVTAVRFLTIVPAPGREAGGTDALGRAAGWFPPVGLGLGALLVVGDRLLAFVFPQLLSALLVLALWKCLSGGIHLDGLADCLDGLAGSSPERSLAIMRDSRVGVFGVLSLILLLMIEWVALAELPPEQRWRTLLLAPMVGRFAPVLLARLSVPATPGYGQGAAFIKGVTTWAVVAGGGMILIAAGLLLWPWGLAVTAAGLVVAWGGVRLLSSRLGGITGDGLGASVELTELVVLLVMVAVARLQLG
jgi:adenosylcobinamide-GDP ribazoletransferase